MPSKDKQNQKLNFDSMLDMKPPKTGMRHSNNEVEVTVNMMKFDESIVRTPFKKTQKDDTVTLPTIEASAKKKSKNPSIFGSSEKEDGNTLRIRVEDNIPKKAIFERLTEGLLQQGFNVSDSKEQNS